jgi:uncharacterized membrane protein
MRKVQNVKLALSIILLVISLVFAFVSLLSPPKGEIHSSVLMFTAEALCFVACCLGIDMVKSRNIVH